MNNTNTRLGNLSVAGRWILSFRAPLFKQKMLLGWAILLCLTPIFPIFYQHIESREGVLYNDWLLQLIPSVDVSIPIFMITWGMAAFTLIRVVQNPNLLLTLLYGVIVVNVSRFITISLVPLNPPVGIIDIWDPITDMFYGAKYVTKDLFYSGHTATQFLFFLVLQKKADKSLAMLTSLTMGMLVLVQHVHYTVDVIFAFPFTYLCFLIARRLAKY